MEKEQSITDNEQHLETAEKYREYSKIFVDTMQMLNEVIDQQNRFILGIAAEAARSAINIAKDANTDNSTDAKLDIDAEKDAAEKIMNKTKKANAKLKSTVESKASQATKSPSIEDIVATNLNLAFQNTVAAQQGLNELGIAVLGKSVNYMHTVVRSLLGMAKEKRK